MRSYEKKQILRRIDNILYMIVDTKFILNPEQIKFLIKYKRFWIYKYSEHEINIYQWINRTKINTLSFPIISSSTPNDIFSLSSVDLGKINSIDWTSLNEFENLLHDICHV